MTTSAPTRPPARRSIVPVAALTAVTCLVTVSFAFADNAPAPTVGGAAALYVPHDGYVSWTLETGGEIDIRRIIEHTRSTGVSDVLALPPLQASYVLDVTGDAVRTTQFWRETTHTLDGADTRVFTDLYTITDAGVSLLAGNGGNLGLVYNPPMVQLPAAVAPGDTWEGRGDALPLGLAHYVLTARALEPEDQTLIAAATANDIDESTCIQVSSLIALTDENHAEFAEIEQRELWCTGRGRVASAVEFDGQSALHATVSPRPDTTSVAEVFPQRWWSNVEAWRARTVPLARDDDFFGEGAVTLALLDTPRATASGLVVASTTSTRDLLAFRVDGERLVQSWVAHPGGVVVTFATAGDVTVVSTSQRQLIAYDVNGNRLWQAPVPELVVAPPTATGDGRVVTAGLDGTITMTRAVTGEQEWSTPLSSDIDVSTVVAADIVAAVDRAGTITALHAQTGEVVWSRATWPARDLRAFGNVIVSVGDDGWMRTFDAATGAPSHAWRYQGSWRALLPVGEAAVLATDEQTLAVDLETGAELWRSAPVSSAVGDGRVMVALRGTQATVLDDRGELVAEWNVPASVVWSSQYLLTLADGILVMHSGTDATLVRPR